MEKHPEIPSDLYGRWWKVINDEYGEIVQTNEEPIAANNDQYSYLDRQDDRSGGCQTEITKTNQIESQPTTKPQTEVGQKLYQLSKEEENNLSVYLELGMSLNEAREQYKKEIEVAQMRRRIRDNTRLKERGSVEASRSTIIGPTTSARGAGRGGLSFN